MSEVTDDVYAESLAADDDAADLRDYNRLL